MGFPYRALEPCIFRTSTALQGLPTNDSSTIPCLLQPFEDSVQVCREELEVLRVMQLLRADFPGNKSQNNK